MLNKYPGTECKFNPLKHKIPCFNLIWLIVITIKHVEFNLQHGISIESMSMIVKFINIPLMKHILILQDIRWCKSVAGQYEVISLQENPQTQIVSQSEDGCTFLQKSEIFYHITDEDNDPEIMCELGYNESSKICGKGRFNSTLQIPTILKGMAFFFYISCYFL